MKKHIDYMDIGIFICLGMLFVYAFLVIGL